jgi:hypothetical protein
LSGTVPGELRPKPGVAGLPAGALLPVAPTTAGELSGPAQGNTRRRSWLSNPVPMGLKRGKQGVRARR